ncbi:hypothetical protein TNCV_1295721 [Trichonephila clavipes]|uniref:Uncharacterized protein n=1 Tax=Trichonephila clavipes TaxID=2585209 RepID=A0A8X6ST36_TRICX|nr:hypothetical protein TNCV_1295721 [Trichonephila clavipes]
MIKVLSGGVAQMVERSLSMRESAYRRKPVSTADIVGIAFFPYGGRESAKRHCALPTMVLEPLTLEDSPCRGVMHVKPVEPQTPSRWCGVEGGHNSLGVKAMDLWLTCHELEPSTTKDPSYSG